MRGLLAALCCASLMLALNATASIPAAQAPPVKSKTSTLPGQDTATLDENLKNARDLNEQKEFDAALVYYRRALKQDPKNTDLIIEAAHVNDDANHHEDAISLLKKVIEIAPDRKDDVLQLLGWQYAALGQPDQAIEIFNDYLSRHPKNNEAASSLETIKQSKYDFENNSNLVLARHMVDIQEYAKALTYYKKQLEMNQNDSDLVIEIARVADWNNQHEDSRGYLELALKIAPYRVDDIIRPLAWQYMALDNPDKAVDLFKDYLRRHPKDRYAKDGLEAAEQAVHDIYWKKAKELYAKREYDEALVFYKKQLALDPTNADLLFQMGVAADNARHHEEARDYFLQFLKLAPHRRDTVLMPLAWQYVDLDDIPNAKKLFQEAADKNPDNADIAGQLKRIIMIEKNGGVLPQGGLVSVVGTQEEAPKQAPTAVDNARELAQNKDYDKSLAIYRKELAKSPNDFDLLVEVAHVEDDAGNHTLAIIMLEKALEAEPKRRDDILVFLAWQYYDVKNVDESEKLFNEYLSRHPDDHDAWIDLAQMYQWAEQYSKALPIYEQLLEKDPDDIVALNGQAKTYHMKGSYLEAESKYKALLERDPNDKDGLLGLADVHKDDGRYIYALREYQELSKNYPKDYDILNSIATCQYNAGYDEIALETLKHVPSGDGENLKDRIITGMGDSFSTGFQHSLDTDDVLSNSVTSSYSLHLKGSPIIITPSWRYALISEYGFHFEGNKLMFNFTDRFGELGGNWGTFWPSLGLGYQNYNDWKFVAWDVGGKWIPVDLLKIYFDANNTPIETSLSLQDRVLYSAITMGMDYNFYPPVTLTLEANAGVLNQRNFRKGIANKFNYDLLHGTETSVGVTGYWMTDSKPYIDQGYFNPDAYIQETFYVDVSHTFAKAFTFEFNGQWGEYIQNPGGPGTVYTISANLTKSFHKLGAFSLYYYQLKTLPWNYANSTMYGLKEFGISYVFNVNYIEPVEKPEFTFISNRGSGR